MAITTLDGGLAGMQPPVRFQKIGIATTAVAVNRYHSTWYEAGHPGAAVAGTAGVDGEALTTHLGQLPMGFSGNSHLARFGVAASVVCTVLLCDRLWQNSDLSVTSTSLQTMTPVAIPARDRNGTTDGVGVMAGIEVSATLGAGTPTQTLSYTNSAGVDSRASVIAAVAANSPVGSFYSFPLAAGDQGVQSVEGYTKSATMTGGAIHLVLYRVLASVGCLTANVEYAVDMLTSGFPRLYDNTVPFIIRQPSATTLTNTNGQFIYTQG